MPSLSQPGVVSDLDDAGDFEAPYRRTLSANDYQRRLAELRAVHACEEWSETEK